LGRPACLKCSSSNRACTGYDRDLIFVNRTPSSRSSTATSVLSKLKAEQQLKDVLVDSKTEAGLRYLFSESSHNSHEFRKYAIKILEATYLPKELVSSRLNPETSKGGFSWVYRLTDLIEPSKSLDASLFAFCLAQLYITGTGNTPLYQCLDPYSTALQHLYTDLDDPDRRFREETLAAIILLSTCEVRNGNHEKHINMTVSFKLKCHLTHFSVAHSFSSIALLTMFLDLCMSYGN
jgi:hypothetical protein